MLSPTEPKDTSPHIQDGAAPPSARKRRPWLVRFLWLAVVAAIAGGVYYSTLPGTTNTSGPRFAGPGPRGGMTPMPVSVAEATLDDVPVVQRALGTVTPLANVLVRPRIGGHLTQIAFTEGQHVEKNDMLAQVDPRPYELALEQARSQLARDKAELANARIDMERYQTLAGQNAVSRQQLDTQIALVRQQEATVQASETAERSAALDLEYTSITSPISGRAGLRLVDDGNYVQAGDSTGIVMITQMQPISVLFSVPQDQVSAISKGIAAGRPLPVTLLDRNRSQTLALGRLETLDNQIDTATGTIKLRAIFDNADGQLFPNQFVNVDLLVDTLASAVTIPSSAVLTGAPGTFVYVVKKADPTEGSGGTDGTAAGQATVSVRKVRSGQTAGDKVAILEGLSAGEIVVTDGSDRLREGTRVYVPTLAPPTADAQQAGDQPRRPRRQGPRP